MSTWGHWPAFCTVNVLVRFAIQSGRIRQASRNDRTSPLDSENRCYDISRPMAETTIKTAPDFASTVDDLALRESHILWTQELKAVLGRFVVIPKTRTTVERKH